MHTQKSRSQKISFISWESYHRRSELLAQHLEANLHFVQYGERGRLLQAPVRYILQGQKSWRILKEEDPDIVIAQNAPIFLVGLVFLYARIHNAQYVVDSHTGAFRSPKWRWSRWLHRILSNKALITIVHNKSDEKIVKRWGCRYLVVGFTPGNYPQGELYPLHNDFNVAMPCSFVDKDEPLKAVLDAARRFPQVGFYITGNFNAVSSRWMSEKPDNCHFTGYLAYDKYIGLLRGVDAIMVLTDWNHTLLMGGFEAVSLGKPLITSDWPVLKDHFCLGTVHVPNTVDGIYSGVNQMQKEYDILKKDILILRDHLEYEWNQKLNKIQELINQEQS
jgi:glycosyltransferase involved in cell wall biosynthesis